MVIDVLENSSAAAALHPAFKLVFDYVKEHNLAEAEKGRIELDGDRVYINVVEVDGKDKSEAVIETHDAYIDMQFLLKGEEVFAWKDRKSLKQQREPYDVANDIAFYTDEAQFYFTLLPGEFVLFFPQDGHAPCIGKGKIKKAIAKVRIK